MSQNWEAQNLSSAKGDGRRVTYLEEGIKDCIVVYPGIINEPGATEKTRPTKRLDITNDTGLIQRVGRENPRKKAASDASGAILERGEVVFQANSPHPPQPFVISTGPRGPGSTLPLGPERRTSHTPSQVATYPQPRSFTSAQKSLPTLTARPPLGRERSCAKVTSEQLKKLESLFRKDHHPSPRMKEELSDALGIDLVRITVGSEAYSHTSNTDI